MDCLFLSGGAPQLMNSKYVPNKARLIYVPSKACLVYVPNKACLFYVPNKACLIYVPNKACLIYVPDKACLGNWNTINPCFMMTRPWGLAMGLAFFCFYSAGFVFLGDSLLSIVLISIVV